LKELLARWNEEDAEEDVEEAFELETIDVVSSLVIQQTHLGTTFTRLAEQWRRETRGVSSTDELIRHPAYQQIIGMGKAVIPLLLRELERNSGRWFWALNKITEEDPVSPEFRGRTQEMIKAWLKWGREKGYQW